MKRTLHPLEKPSDGPVSLLLNRPISRAISAPLASAGVSPAFATLLALAAGGAAAAAFAFREWWLGALLLQLSSILSGVDGEIARRTGRESRYGDFLDTVVDRTVEYAALFAIAYALSDSWDNWAWAVGLVALGGTFLLATTSEKYRSTVHSNYPKRQLEPAFAFVTSGRDVRIFYIAVAALVATWQVDVMFWTLVVLSALLHANVVWRVILLRNQLR